MIKNKIELLAPAGNLEKLKIAINYGADAVYLAGKNFSLRNFSENFSLEEMQIAKEITSSNKVKMYVTINIYSRNDDEKEIIKYLYKIKEIQPDGIIIADPAIFSFSKKILPKIPIHISTQANITNVATTLFWEKLGAKRINLARELSLREIKEIVASSKIEIETFVHGSMCIAYSGRCLMSNYINKRGSNQGMCSQPCRFNYAVMEKKRPGEYFPLYEDSLGSYIFSSKDLCMINHLDLLIKAGISSLKIEGRMKSINYLATTTKVYREAIDNFYNKTHSDYDSLINNWQLQLNGISNRGYCTGFFFKEEHESPLISKGRNSTTIFAAKVLQTTLNNKTLILVKNKIFIGDKILILSPKSFFIKHDKIRKIMNEKGEKVLFSQPGSIVNIILENNCHKLDILQKIKK